MIAPDGRYSARDPPRGPAPDDRPAEPDPARHDRARRQVASTPNRDAFSPDGDHQADFVRIAYALSKPAHVNLYLDGKRILRTFRHPAKGTLSWYGNGERKRASAGHVHARGRRASTPPATARRSPSGSIRVEIRFIAAREQAHRRASPARVLDRRLDRRDAYTWKLGRAQVFAPGPVLRLQAPTRAGRYTLTVTEHGPCRSRSGARQVSGLAQLGGPVACLGLALLLVGGTARDRIAGLGFAALGTVVLGVARRAAPAARSCSAACSLRSASASGSRVSSARVPWLLPVLALACVPIRIGVHVGGASSKLLVPLYVVILGAAILLAWQLVEGDARVRELRPLTWPLAAFVALDGAVARLEQGRERRRDRAARVLRPVHAARARDRAAAVEPARPTRRCTRSSRVMALAFAVVGFYQYETRDIFQNPKVINVERVRAVLPRQLGVLGSVGLRALPRASR